MGTGGYLSAVFIGVLAVMLGPKFLKMWREDRGVAIAIAFALFIGPGLYFLVA